MQVITSPLDFQIYPGAKLIIPIRERDTRMYIPEKLNLRDTSVRRVY